MVIRGQRNFACPPHHVCGADPVSFSTGNHVVTVPLFRIPNRGGLDIDGTLTYNAQDKRDDLFGVGWSSPYNVRVHAYDDDSVDVILDDGRTAHYTKSGGGYTAPAGVYDRLEDTSDGWRVLTRDEQVLTFQDTFRDDYSGFGILTEWRDRRGNALHFEYNLAGQNNWMAGELVPRARLTAVRDDAGRTVSVDTDADSHVTALTLPDGRRWSFAYADGDLTAITDANTAQPGTRRFQYDAQHRITHEWDKANILYLHNSYDGQHRVVGQVDANVTPSTITYDPTGGLTTYTDPGGNHFVYRSDDLKRVTSQADPQGGTTSTVYDENYNVTARTDARGNVTTATYDARGNMTSRADPLAACSDAPYASDLTRWEYDPDHNQATKMTDALGHAWTYEYDAAGNRVLTIDPTGAETRATYNVWGQPLTVTDGNHHTTTYTYDTYGNRTTVTDANGHISRSTYDIVGRELSYTDANGHTVQIANDANDRIIGITDPKGQPTSFVYDRNDLLIQSVDRRGVAHDYQYDVNLKLVAERAEPTGAWLRYGYDALYRRATMTDRRGYTTRYGYDAVGRPTSVSDPNNAVTRAEYDLAGNIIATTDAAGARTLLTYDAANRLASRTDAAGGVVRFCYDAEDRLVQASGPRAGERYRFAYDALGRLVSVTDPQDNVRRYEHDALGNLAAAVDPLGHRTNYGYDALNRVRAVVRPPLSDGARPTVQLGYDPVGNTVAITAPRGFATRFAYDANDNPETITDAQGGRTITTYDAEDHPLAVTDANGHTTTTTYSPVGLPLAVRDARGFTTRLEYDADYHPVRMVDALNHPTIYEYDRPGRLIRQRDGLGNATTYKRDGLGRVTAVDDPNGHTTGYSYDALGRLLAVTDALGHPTRYEYDAASNLVGTTDANGQTTIFTYDLLNQLLGEGNPLGDTWRYAYDPAQRLNQRVDALGRRTSYEYDSNDRLLGIQYSAPASEQPPVLFAYDVDGNQTGMCDGLGCTHHTYDALNRRTSTTDWLNRTVRHAYDGVGNPVEMVYPNNRPVRYEYDATNQVVGVTDPRGQTSVYERNGLGQATRLLHPNNVLTSFAYDAANQLTGVDNRKQGAAQPQSAFRYTLDRAGNRTASSETRAAFDGSAATATLRHRYGYDALNRLTRAATDAPARDTAYSFDTVGNRTAQSGTSLAPDPGLPMLPVAARPEQASATYNGANQLLTMGNDTFGYNANGERTHETTLLANGKTETTAYRYDREGRLAGVQTSVDGVQTLDARYEYDGYGRRARKTVIRVGQPSATTTFLYDGLEIIDVAVETQGRSVETYYYLAPSPVTGMRRPVEAERLDTGARGWYQTDGLDSVTALTDERGAITAALLYDEYGQLLAGASDLALFTYTAQDADAETGLLHFYARYYDPARGVWLTQDPYRGRIAEPMTLHRYGYVGASPINFYDVYGFTNQEENHQDEEQQEKSIFDYVKIIVDDIKLVVFSMYNVLKESVIQAIELKNSWENAKKEAVERREPPQPLPNTDHVGNPDDNLKMYPLMNRPPTKEELESITDCAEEGLPKPEKGMSIELDLDSVIPCGKALPAIRDTTVLGDHEHNSRYEDNK